MVEIRFFEGCGKLYIYMYGLMQQYPSGFMVRIYRGIKQLINLKIKFRIILSRLGLFYRDRPRRILVTRFLYTKMTHLTARKRKAKETVLHLSWHTRCS